jgi:hypothetical protein
MDKSEKSENKSWITSKTFLTIFGTLFALIFIVLMVVINVASQIEDIDEKLKYMPPKTEAIDISPKAVVAGQVVYVPVYSHIYAEGGKPILLETTLSIRNTDRNQEITITAVDYFDTNGNLVKDYLGKSVSLKPLATAEFLVPEKEIEGGSGANFIVAWVSLTKVNQPVIEAVMVGSEGQARISFVRSGIPVEKE